MESSIQKQNSSILKVDVQKVTRSEAFHFSDDLAVEEPLEIRLEFDKPAEESDHVVTKNFIEREQKSVSITMRTPGHDFDLAVGFLFTEALIGDASDIIKISYCGPKLKHLGHSNVVKVELKSGVRLDLKSMERHFYTSSSCGVCGKASIDALKTQNKFSVIRGLEEGPIFSSDAIYKLPQALREAQNIFERTGGLHASGIFNSHIELISVREDVGRHNALDKVIGAALMSHQIPLKDHLLLVSGRVSFELVQKASMAGIAIIAAVGAPSSLALDLAKEMNMTLIGFVRDEKFNIYCGQGRIK